MAKSDPNLLTQAEYARSRKTRGLSGGSREAVRKAVDEKRISVFGPDKLIDQHLADTQWERNTRARLSPQASVDHAAGQGTAAVELFPTQSVETSPPTQPASAQTKTPAPDTGYAGARARREEAEAEKAEIETAKLRGSLVMREDIERGGFDIGREIRDAMESAVNSLSAELAALTSADACAQVLRRHNRAVQDILVASFRERIGLTVKGHA